MAQRPITSDYDRYPTGCDLKHTESEIGLHGHWAMLHSPMVDFFILVATKMKKIIDVELRS